MKKTNPIYIGNSLLLSIMMLLTVCLSACEEITDEMYKDIEMVIPEETIDFKSKALKLEEYTLVTVTDIVFHENLKPLDIKVDELRLYIDGRLLTELTVPDPYTPQTLEYKLENLDESEHILRLEFDLSGEGFLPGTGAREKELNINDLSNPYLYVNMLTFDDKTFVQVDTLDLYWSDYKDLTIKEARYYINETLVGTDKEEPFSFRGFTDKADYGEHQFAVRFDVVTPSGLEATHIVQKQVRADTLFNSYIRCESVNFESKTYLEVDTLDYYTLDRLNLTIKEARYYVDGQLTGTVTDEPFCFVGLIPALPDSDHTLKIEMDVTDEKGDKAINTSIHTFKPYNNAQYMTCSAINFDDKCYLQVDEIDTPYRFDALGLTITEMRFYVDDKLIGTDNVAPYSYQGFINKLADTNHQLKIIYDVTTSTGETANRTLTTAVHLYQQPDRLYSDAFPFNEKTYIQIDDISLPYSLSSMGLKFSEIRFYLNDQLIDTDKEKPYGYDCLINLLYGDTHTVKAIYDVTAPDGTIASWTMEDALEMHTNNTYMHPEEPSQENGYTFKMNDLSFSWEIYKCQLEMTEAKYYIDGQLVKTIDKAPFTFEIANPTFDQGLHKLRLEYKVKDTTGTTATWQDETSFYISKD